MIDDGYYKCGCGTKFIGYGDVCPSCGKNKKTRPMTDDEITGPAKHVVVTNKHRSGAGAGYLIDPKVMVVGDTPPTGVAIASIRIEAITIRSSADYDRFRKWMDKLAGGFGTE